MEVFEDTHPPRIIIITYVGHTIYISYFFFINSVQSTKYIFSFGICISLTYQTYKKWNLLYFHEERQDFGELAKACFPVLWLTVLALRLIWYDSFR